MWAERHTYIEGDKEVYIFYQKGISRYVFV